MTKNEFKNKLLTVLNNDKESLINCNLIQLEEIKEKGQNKLRLEKYNRTAGQIAYINQLINYINCYIEK